MNKKGFLLGEETLKIVIAIICILFLIYVLVSIYYGGFGDENTKLAKASVEHLVNELNAGATEIQIYNPKGWIIMNWKNDENWICICKDIDECDPDDTCAKPKEKVIVENSVADWIKIENPPITLKLNEGVLSLK